MLFSFFFFFLSPDTKTEVEGFSIRDITNKDIRYKDGSGKKLPFFAYRGTSFEPPCYVVNWYIFKDPLEISDYQVITVFILLSFRHHSENNNKKKKKTKTKKPKKNITLFA